MKKRYIAAIVVVPVALLATFVWPGQVRFGGETVPVSTEPVISMGTFVGSSIHAAPVSDASKIDAAELYNLTGRSAVAAQQLELVAKTPQQVTALSENVSESLDNLYNATEEQLAEMADYVEEVTGENSAAVAELRREMSRDLAEVREAIAAQQSSTAVNPQPARAAFAGLPRLGFGSTSADLELARQVQLDRGENRELARQLQEALGRLVAICEQNETEDAQFEELLGEVEVLKAEPEAPDEDGSGSTD